MLTYSEQSFSSHIHSKFHPVVHACGGSLVRVCFTSSGIPSARLKSFPRPLGLAQDIESASVLRVYFAKTNRIQHEAKKALALFKSTRGKRRVSSQPEVQWLRCQHCGKWRRLALDMDPSEFTGHGQVMRAPLYFCGGDSVVAVIVNGVA